MKHCKCIVQEDNNKYNEYVVDNQLLLSPIEDAFLATYHERYREDAHFFLNVWHHLNI